MNLLLFLSDGCCVRLEANGASPGSRAGLASLENPLGLLGQVFDHQAPPTRPREGLVVACSTSRRGWMHGDEDPPWPLGSRNAPKSWIFRNFRKMFIFRIYGTVMYSVRLPTSTEA